MPEDNAMGIFILPLVTLTMSSSKSETCFYCSEYVKVVIDYPMNPPSNDLETFTPRCNLQWNRLVF